VFSLNGNISEFSSNAECMMGKTLLQMLLSKRLIDVGFGENAFEILVLGVGQSSLHDRRLKFLDNSNTAHDAIF
jgi:hypothetical protein